MLLTKIFEEKVLWVREKSNINYVEQQLCFPVQRIHLNDCVAQMVKNCLQCRRPVFDSWVRKVLWRREQQPTPVFLPGESQGQRNLAGYSPWGRKELDRTERDQHSETTTTSTIFHSISCQTRVCYLSYTQLKSPCLWNT